MTNMNGDDKFLNLRDRFVVRGSWLRGSMTSHGGSDSETQAPRPTARLTGLGNPSGH
ncbi:hypothetical protein BJY01DRAFT_217953 [Aspergillus pseudoustus]|uniref:Uncharacterized protein n=1 Tax=Aspergillus pseudoustus TaxID=1810923 RepID=A0ABR4JMI1_9EURO